MVHIGFDWGGMSSKIHNTAKDVPVSVLYNAVPTNVNKKKPTNNPNSFFFPLAPYFKHVQQTSEFLAGLFCICMTNQQEITLSPTASKYIASGTVVLTFFYLLCVIYSLFIKKEGLCVCSPRVCWFFISPLHWAWQELCRGKVGCALLVPSALRELGNVSGTQQHAPGSWAKTLVSIFVCLRCLVSQGMPGIFLSSVALLTRTLHHPLQPPSPQHCLPK